MKQIDARKIIGKIVVQVGPERSLDIGNFYLAREYCYQETNEEVTLIDLLDLREMLWQTSKIEQHDVNGIDYRYRVLEDAEIENLKKALAGLL